MSSIANPIGSIAYFAEEGLTIESVTVSSASGGKPAGSTLDDWRALGCIEKFTPAKSESGGVEKTCFDATVGRRVSIGRRGGVTSLKLNMTLNEIDEKGMALAFGIDSLTTHAGIPLAGTQGGMVRGWLRLSGYVDGNLCLLGMLWGELRCTKGPEMDGNAPAMIDLEFNALYNANATLTLSNDLADS